MRIVKSPGQPIAAQAERKPEDRSRTDFPFEPLNKKVRKSIITSYSNLEIERQLVRAAKDDHNLGLLPKATRQESPQLDHCRDHKNFAHIHLQSYQVPRTI